MTTDDTVLIGALRYLAADGIESEDGVANAAIAEAANRLEELLDQKNKAVNDYLLQQVHVEELQRELKEAQDYADRLVAHKDMICLPADLANLREANAHFATENWKLKEKLRILEEAAAHREYVSNSQPQ